MKQDGRSETLLEQRPREVPVHLAVILLRARRTMKLVARQIGAVVDRRSREQLMGEFVNGRAPDASADGLQYCRPTGPFRCIPDGAVREHLEIDGPGTSEPGDRPGRTGNRDVSAKPQVA